MFSSSPASAWPPHPRPPPPLLLLLLTELKVPVDDPDRVKVPGVVVVVVAVVVVGFGQDARTVAGPMTTMLLDGCVVGPVVLVVVHGSYRP